MTVSPAACLFSFPASCPLFVMFRAAQIPLLIAVTCLPVVGCASRAQCEEVEPAQPVAKTPHAAGDSERGHFFRSQVQPILSTRCFACHGPDEDSREAGLRLDTEAGVLAELDSGQRAVVRGQPQASELILRITAADEDLRMPPADSGEQLTQAEVEILRKWIADGAVWQGHWAFSPLTRPQPPQVQQRDWIKTPVDTFILSRLEHEGLAPNVRADKIALLRRASYDLTGLPPEPAAVDAFLADNSPRAWETVVERLLDSPQYGEKWGRQWLDLVRYAESNSFERDNPKPEVWRYRDYVIGAFNQDKPFDQFIREQLAGDELDEVTADSIIATGFYRLGLWDDEPSDRIQSRADELDDIVTTTSQVFLGLTMNCARCHDHKLDPILQRDYYRMVAFFQNIKPYDNGRNVLTPIPTGQQQTAALHELNQKKQAVQRAIVAIEQAAAARLAGVDKDDFRFARDQQRLRLLQKNIPHAISQADFERYERLLADRSQLQSAKLPGNVQALSVTEKGAQAPDTYVLVRGNPHAQGEKVQPGFPQILDATAAVLPTARQNARSSGRRRVLAEWLASPQNPLTARVIANRIWQHHFGRGIVRSPNNFGLQGRPPTHPQLLDWLASELVSGDWRLKRMHKLIMLSATYQMSSRGNEQALLKDPQNDLFWRYNMRRLAAEEIRDSILAVNGRLNLKIGGPGIYEQIPQEVMAGQSRPGANWGKSNERERARRSIYIHVK
ncbi:MAG: DUF1549 domain-containing protein, partial [Planctomycetota bacterium]|nr:DUF1549 domain-containing protein [Planctomycetota bacterium]